MNECKKMQDVVTRLAERNAFDLQADEASMRLSQGVKGLMDLTIEKVGPDKVFIGHSLELDGELVPDPWLWLRITPGGWVPTCIEQAFLGPRFCKAGSAEETEFAEFAEEWAETIEERFVRTAPED